MRLIPTELEIQMQAATLFPGNLELQSSFIMGTWMTIYKMKMPKNVLRSKTLKGETESD